MSRADEPLPPSRADVDPDLRRALLHLERPRARPEFRAELARRFVDGAAADTAREAAPVERTRGGMLVLGALLAAAAAVVMTLFLTRARDSVWSVDDASSAKSVVVDGVEIPGTDRARIADALSSARELEARGGSLRLTVRGEARLEIQGGTRLSQMKFAAAGPYQLRADDGSLAVSTLPAFGGRGMRVLTEDFDLFVTGTTFGVDVDARGSCLCTLEGDVACKPAGLDARPVETGRSCFSHRDGRAPDWVAAREAHLEPLRRLRALRDERKK